METIKLLDSELFSKLHASLQNQQQAISGLTLFSNFLDEYKDDDDDEEWIATRRKASIDGLVGNISNIRGRINDITKNAEDIGEFFSDPYNSLIWSVFLIAHSEKLFFGSHDEENRVVNHILDALAGGFVSDEVKDMAEKLKADISKRSGDESDDENAEAA